MQLEVISFGVEHVNGFAATALHHPMKLSERLRFLQGVIIVIPVHIESLMRDAILIDGVSAERAGTLEENYVVIAASEPVKRRYFAVNRHGVRTVGITARASHELHAQDLGVETRAPDQDHRPGCPRGKAS
jgi:hypothetical protein